MLFLKMFFGMIVIALMIVAAIMLSLKNSSKTRILGPSAELLQKRVYNKHYIVSEKINHFCDYMDIEDQETDDFITFWYA